ncbi:MAG: glycosyltransferase family 2 protein [Lewinellaceae bacterium]|nr:glycosyltransferase family 2 protein [Lewinellaceae bacterium]
MISVVLVTFNRAERLKGSIQDILDQTFQDFEIIICDDASTDSTALVCRDFADRDTRIFYFRQPQNVGMPNNLISGFQMARYPYLAILHDGDRFDNQLLERWYEGIQASSNIGLVFNATGIMNKAQELTKCFMEFEEGIIEGNQLLEKVFFRRWHFDSPVYGEAMIRKDVLNEIGYFDKRFGFYADVDFWMRLLHRYDAYYCRSILIKGRKNNSTTAFCRQYDTHLPTYEQNT